MFSIMGLFHTLPKVDILVIPPPPKKKMMAFYATDKC